MIKILMQKKSIFILFELFAVSVKRGLFVVLVETRLGGGMQTLVIIILFLSYLVQGRNF